MPDPLRLYWDANVMLSYINEHPERLSDIEAFLAQADDGQVTLMTSVLSVAEVAFGVVEQTRKVLDPDTEERINSLWAPQGPILLVEFHVLIADGAKQIQRAGVPKGWTGLRSVDAMHLATAQREQVQAVHTYDPKLPKYAEVIGCPVGPPEALRPLLGL